MTALGQVETFPASTRMSEVEGRPDVARGWSELRFLAITGSPGGTLPLANQNRHSEPRWRSGSESFLESGTEQAVVGRGSTVKCARTGTAYRFDFPAQLPNIRSAGLPAKPVPAVTESWRIE